MHKLRKTFLCERYQCCKTTTTTTTSTKTSNVMINHSYLNVNYEKSFALKEEIFAIPRYRLQTFPTHTHKTLKSVKNKKKSAITISSQIQKKYSWAKVKARGKLSNHIGSDFFFSTHKYSVIDTVYCKANNLLLCCTVFPFVSKIV